MAVDRRGTGLTIIRVLLGAFFIAQALLKVRWLLRTTVLATQLTAWLQEAAPGSISHAYLQRLAIPGVAIFARLVPIGEFTCGVALLLGFSTPLAAFTAFFMVLNYQIASGAIFQPLFVADRAALPVLAATLGLAWGGVRLPWSLRG
jgi:uncharacterized membrane protein YphA (DoxX/SURF4 family)